MRRRWWNGWNRWPNSLCRKRGRLGFRERRECLLSTHCRHYLDVYDYLLHGIKDSETRLQNGDVVFVPVHSGFVKIAGEVTRPAVYEMLPQETLRDLIDFAGGFGPAAYQTRVRIHRILPPESRSGGTRARVVVDVAPEQMAGGTAPAVPMRPSPCSRRP